MEALAQGLPGPVDSGFDGFFRAFHDVGDFGVGEVVVFAEHNGGALVFGKGGDGVGDLLFEFASRDGVGWRGFVAGRVYGEVVQRIGGVTFAPTDPVEGGVAGDAKEPGAEFPGGIEIVTVLVDANEHILGRVLGVGLVAENAMEEIVDGVLVSMHEDVERGVVPAGKACHERGVGFLFERLHATMRLPCCQNRL